MNYYKQNEKHKWKLRTLYNYYEIDLLQGT